MPATLDGRGQSFLASCFTWLQYAANHHDFNCTNRNIRTKLPFEEIYDFKSQVTRDLIEITRQAALTPTRRNFRRFVLKTRSRYPTEVTSRFFSRSGAAG